MSDEVSRLCGCALVVIACSVPMACKAVSEDIGGPMDAPTGDSGIDPEQECGSNDVPPQIGQLARPTVNRDRGFADEPFDVTLAADVKSDPASAGAEIVYTLDGSVPTETNGMRGPGPVTVRIAKTTVLRARTIAAGKMASSVATYSYIFLSGVLEQPRAPAGYPLLRIPDDPKPVTLDYAMDPNVVGPSPGELQRGLTEIPSLSIAMDHDDMFGTDGIYDSGGSGKNSMWERAASVEMLAPGKPSWQFQIDSAIRPHTHVLVKRSFKLVFKKQYGPGKLRSCLMRGAPLSGESATKEFDSLILRGGTNRSISAWCNPDDSTYIEDQWMHDTQIAMSGAGGRGTFVHLYINGLYFGLYNAMERPDDSFLASYFGGKKSEWFSINHGGIVDGDPARWQYLTTTLAGKDMSVAANYEELKKYLDVEQFIDYILLNWFAGRTDWPNNNWYAGNRNNPPGPVRFFIWDADEVWDGRCQGPGDPAPDIYGARVLPPFKVGSTDQTATARIWQAARKSSAFKQLLVQRVNLHLGPGGALSEAASVARLDRLATFIERAFLAETARWGDARAEYGERTRTRQNMWRPTLDRWRNQRIPGNGDRLIQSMKAQGYYP